MVAQSYSTFFCFSPWFPSLGTGIRSFEARPIPADEMEVLAGTGIKKQFMYFKGGIPCLDDGPPLSK